MHECNARRSGDLLVLCVISMKCKKQLQFSGDISIKIFGIQGVGYAEAITYRNRY